MIAPSDPASPRPAPWRPSGAALVALVAAGCAARAGGAPPGGLAGERGRVVLAAGPEQDAELVTRTRGELDAAGFAVVVVRPGAAATAGEPGAPLVRLASDATRQRAVIELPAAAGRPREQQTVTVDLVSGDAADRSGAAAELALRAAELVGARVAARAAPASAPAETAAATGAGGAVAALGLGATEGVLPGQLSLAAAGLVGWRGARGHRVALAGLLPLTDAAAEAPGGRAELRAAVALVEGQLRAWQRGPLALGLALGAGAARASIAGRGEAPNRGVAAAAWALALGAGAELGVDLGGAFTAALAVRALSVLPRPGLLIADARAGASRWVLPTATLTLGARF